MVQLLQTRAELSRWRRHQSGGPLHFVPTMGSLHHGHGELLRRASASGPAGRPVVLLSVFVNPLQFSPSEDFERYPRDLAADAVLAQQAGADALFAPAVAELFPGGDDHLTRVLPPATLIGSLCGPGRPGHFEGVATVICRLLALVRPDRLWLGEKDWQQLTILRRVLADLALPVTVQSCATVRDADGLACSSRHRYLSPQERRQAKALPEALRAALGRWRDGSRSAARLTASLRRDLEAAGLAVEYTQIVQPTSLEVLPEAVGLSLLAACVRCGGTRLIDHVFLMHRPPIVAIDGPAGAGKSTVTRSFARRMGLLYLDTGAMYRSLTWWVLHRGVDPADAAAIATLLDDLDLQLEGGSGGEQRVRVNGHEVSEEIRGPEVTARVSAVAAHGCVRAALTRQQRAMGQRGGLVAEGRDIGTAVFPEAECKVFLTASVTERARRRAADLQQRGFPVPPLVELEAQIAERDQRDSSRAEAPLCQAADAVELVTDGLAIEAVLQRLVDLFRERVPEDAWQAPLAGAESP
jgi:pantoate ligase/cytidylate kinase